MIEKLKAENQMMWVGKMNNLIACAEGGGVCVISGSQKAAFWLYDVSLNLQKYFLWKKVA